MDKGLCFKLHQRRGLRVWRLWLLLWIAAGCAPLEQPPVLAHTEVAAAELSLVLDRVRTVDLSHPYNSHTLYWPSSPSAFEHGELDYGITPGGYFYSAYTLGTPEHGGTHLDAPIHFDAQGKTVEQLTLDQLMLPVVVIDVVPQADNNSDYQLTVADVTAFEAQYGPIAEGSGVLVRTRWDRFWPDAKTYLGDDTPKRTTHLHFPGFGAPAVSYLLAERGVKLIGIDTASIDHGPSREFEVHRIISAANVPALENLTGLQYLPPKGAFLIALPMKVEGGSGAPARVVALVP